MSDLTSICALFDYNDRMNRLVFERAGTLDDERLDRPLEIGLGTLRKILDHVYIGELVWLGRWEGAVETRWAGDAARSASPQELLAELERVRERRERFLAGLDGPRLDAVQQYRDSRGSLFEATLRDMLLQGIVHSTHHRAQIVNAIRRLGGEPPEVDYMYSVRRPV